MKSILKPLPFAALRDHVRFLGRLVISPRNVGAIAPSGAMLADAMVAPLPLDGPILELGPGPGAFTRAILRKGLIADQLTLIERDPEFVRTLQRKFPGVHVLHGDALHLDQLLPPHQYHQKFSGVISGLPLLNFPVAVREKLVADVLDYLQPGAPFVQFSYGLNSPVRESQTCSVEQSAFVWNNLPPARVWVYRRK